MRWFVLFFCFSSLFANHLTQENACKLLEHYKVDQDHYLVLDNETVWKIYLENEREQTWGEWFLGTKPPQITPNTNDKPHQWSEHTMIEICKANEDQIHEYAYKLFNSDFNERAIACKVPLMTFIKIVQQQAKKEGKQEGEKKGYERGYQMGKLSSEGKKKDSSVNHYEKGYFDGYAAAFSSPQKNTVLIQSIDNHLINKIKLSNGCVFEVDPLDNQLLQSWMPMQTVEVMYEIGENNPYPVKIINLSNDSFLYARRE